MVKKSLKANAKGAKNTKIMKSKQAEGGPAWRASSVPAAYSMQYTKLGQTITVAHKEIFASLQSSTGTVDFTLIGASAGFPGYDINPANALMFPWLSNVARGYEKYRFNDLAIHIMSRSPTSTQGAYYAAIDYDWDDPVATSAIEVMANTGAVTANTWKSSAVKADVSRLNADMPFRYVSDNERFNVSDRMTYAGFFELGVAGISSTYQYDLVVEYSVTFMLPCTPKAVNPKQQALANVLTLLPASPAGFEELPQTSGLKVVQMGVDGAPIATGVANTACKGYQIKRTSGVVNLQSVLASSGVAPSTVATDTKFDVRVYDYAGTLLTATLSVLLPTIGGSIYHGPVDSATWSVGGGFGTAIMSIGLDVLKRAFPNAAYVVPVLQSAAGRTLTTASFLKSWATEL